MAMQRAMAIGLLAVGLAGCMPLDLGGGPSGELTGLVPDPSYQPQVGDRAVLYGFNGSSPMDALPLLKDMTSYDVFERLAQANSSHDMTDMEQRGDLQWSPLGTRVIVLALHDRSHTGSRLAAEVRPVEGPRKDRTVWVPRPYLAKLIPPPHED